LPNYPKDHKEQVVVKPELKETVFLGNNKGGVFKVETKAKGVTISNCENIAVFLTSVVGNVEVVNCKKVQVQIAGTAPIIQVDASDRTSIHLSAGAVAGGTRVYSAKSASTNIYTPQGDDEQEHAVPEQFVSQVKSGKLHTEVVIPGKE